MTDIALLWDAEAFAGDIAVREGAIVIDDGLRTAILISLFSDARAAADEPLPTAGGDRRGWWGDAFSAPGNGLGSKLWLLARSKITPQVIARARDHARAALAWLIEDGVAKSIEVEAVALAPGTLAIGVAIERPSGPGRQRFDFTWNASTGEVA